MMSRALALNAFLTACAFGSAACAASGTVVITFSGEAFDGPPAFVVKFDGAAIGSGTVNAAIDTATGGRLAEAARIEPYLETFEYTVPDGLFSPDGTIAIEFPNDAYGGIGTGLDRNLVIYSLVVNGRAVGPKEITILANGSPTSQELIRDRVALSTDGLSATVRAPASGWPALPPVEATLRPDQESAPAPQPAIGGELSMPDSAPAEREAAVTPPSQPEPVPVPVCQTASLAVLDFGRGFIGVPASQQPELDELARSVPADACRVEVTGYSSLGGDAELNKSIAEARATAVLTYLKQQGGAFAAEQVVAFGETDQFGPTGADNQRVVVEVGP